MLHNYASDNALVIWLLRYDLPSPSLHFASPFGHFVSLWYHLLCSCLLSSVQISCCSKFFSDRMTNNKVNTFSSSYTTSAYITFIS